jgi:hypothetical protein
MAEVKLSAEFVSDNVVGRRDDCSQIANFLDVVPITPKGKDAGHGGLSSTGSIDKVERKGKGEPTSQNLNRSAALLPPDPRFLPVQPRLTQEEARPQPESRSP